MASNLNNWWWCSSPLLWHFETLGTNTHLFLKSRVEFKISYSLKTIILENGILKVPAKFRGGFHTDCIDDIQEQLETALCEMYDWFKENE